MAGLRFVRAVSAFLAGPVGRPRANGSFHQFKWAALQGSTPPSTSPPGGPPSAIRGVFFLCFPNFESCREWIIWMTTNKDLIWGRVLKVVGEGGMIAKVSRFACRKKASLPGVSEWVHLQK